MLQASHKISSICRSLWRLQLPPLLTMSSKSKQGKGKNRSKGNGKQGGKTSRRQQQEWQQHVDENPADIYVRSHQLGPYGADRRPLPPPSEEPDMTGEMPPQPHPLCDLSDSSNDDPEEEDHRRRLQWLHDQTVQMELQANERRKQKELKRRAGTQAHRQSKPAATPGPPSVPPPTAKPPSGAPPHASHSTKAPPPNWKPPPLMKPPPKSPPPLMKSPQKSPPPQMATPKFFQNLQKNAMSYLQAAASAADLQHSRT